MNENKENVVNVFEGLKGSITASYVVSGNYSSRKIENRTSIEYPMVLNVGVIDILSRTLQLIVIQSSAKQAYQARYIDEEAFYFELIPTFYELVDLKEQVNNFVKENDKKLSKVDEAYVKKAVQYLRIVAGCLKDFDVSKKAEELTTQD